MTVFTIHLAVLSWTSWFIASRCCVSNLERMLAAFILLWGNIAITGYALSLFECLDNSVLYFHVSIILNLMAVFLLRKKQKARAIEEEFIDHEFITAVTTPWGAFISISALFVFFASFAICAYYIPNNWDSLTYHLPRVLLYISQGTLSYIPASNARLFTFPLTETLFRVFLAHYGQPDRLFNFFSLCCWMIGWPAVFVLARRSGISALGSLTGAWVAMMGTQVVAQASATTNDLICAVPFVIGVLFVLNWLRKFQLSQLLLAGFAFGLAFGTKLTLLFCGPVVTLFFIVFLKQFYTRKNRTLSFSKLFQHISISCIITILLSTPFMVYNMQGIGTPLTHDYDYALNKPFSVKGALQTMYGFTMQICLNPLLELATVPASSDLYRTIRNKLESVSKKNLFAFWNDSYAFSELNIFATDITEDHVFFGVCGPLLIISALFSLLRPKGWKSPVFWVSGLAVGWFLTFCTLYKWSLYNQRYFNFLALLCGPGVGLLFDQVNSCRRGLLKTASIAAFGVVAVCSLLFAWNYLMFNSNRNISDLTGSHFSHNYPLPSRMFSEFLKDKNAFSIFQLGNEHINERIYPFMRLMPRQSIQLVKKIIPGQLNIISTWAATRQFIYTNIPSTAAYALLPITQKKTPGVCDFGSLGSDPLNLFRYYAWDGREKYRSGTDYNYILAMLQYPKEGDYRFDHPRFMLVGLNSMDDIVFRLSLVTHDNKIIHVLDSNQDLDTKLDLEHGYKSLILEAVSQATGDIISSSVILVKIFNHDPKDIYINAPGNQVDLAEQNQTDWLTVSGFSEPNGPTSELMLSSSRWMLSEKAWIRYVDTDAKQKKHIVLDIACQPQLSPHAGLVLYWNGIKVGELQMKNAFDRQQLLLTLPVSPGKNELTFERKGDEDNSSNKKLLFSRLQLHEVGDKITSTVKADN